MAIQHRAGHAGQARRQVQVDTSGATPGTDYVALTNVPVPLIPGATTTPVIVTVNGDNTIEADEQVTLTLSNPSPGVSLDVSSGNGTIQNDDGVPSVSVDDVTVTEGDVTEHDQGLVHGLVERSGDRRREDHRRCGRRDRQPKAPTS